MATKTKTIAVANDTYDKLKIIAKNSGFNTIRKYLENYITINDYNVNIDKNTWELINTALKLNVMTSVDELLKNVLLEKINEKIKSDELI